MLRETVTGFCAHANPQFRKESRALLLDRNGMEYLSSNTIYLPILLALFIISIWAQSRVQKVFNKHANTQVSSGMRAEEIVQTLLSGRGYNVKISPVKGALTDHYNPKTEEVGLSEQVYGSNSISAVAVAAHEIGHVMQYQEGFGLIRLRNAILPVAGFASQAAPWLVILGAFLGNFNLAMTGVVLFGAILAFQLITLPVEFDASSRALRMLEEGSFITYAESDAAKKVLNAAAMTYVLATLSVLISFMRLLSIAGRTRRR